MNRIVSILVAILVSLSAAAGNAKYVNMFMGTAGDHGQVSPAAQVPFGLASVCPDCIVKDRHAGYDFDVPRISGISVTRMSGTGGDGTGGNLRILPALPGAEVSIVKGTEKAVPGFYSAQLDNGVKVELTATKHCAIERYFFTFYADLLLYIYFNSALDPRRSECSYSQMLYNGHFRGWFKTSTVCNFGEYKLYFFLTIDCPFVVEKQDDTSALLRFDSRVNEVEVRIALSSCDEESAMSVMSAECQGSFKKIRKEAANAWNKQLGKVDVSGGTKEQRTLFYTSLYRLFLSPFDATFLGYYRAADGERRQISGRTFYSGWSMWDTYRTKFPMLCLLAPDEMEDICFSLCQLYRSGKRNWATMDEPVPTVRTEHSQITLLDALGKGVISSIPEDVFPLMEAEADRGRTPGARDGLTRNAPDQMMETIYDLWSMSRIAASQGNEEAAERYRTEAEDLFETTWKREFLTITPDFDKMRGNGMYQGTRWQYRWAMPVYAGKMSEWVGQETLASQLDEFFSRHLFNQGNEPDIQTPFMFHLFGHPEKTDSLVHALLTDDKMIHIYGGNAEFPEPYVGRAFRNAPDGYAPEMDEDDGTMSAWLMFAQMGFYPVAPGVPEYVMFTPQFRKVMLHVGNYDVSIMRRCAPASARRIVVDGKILDGFTITHAQLLHAHIIEIF